MLLWLQIPNALPLKDDDDTPDGEFHINDKTPSSVGISTFGDIEAKPLLPPDITTQSDRLAKHQLKIEQHQRKCIEGLVEKKTYIGLVRSSFLQH